MMNGAVLGQLARRGIEKLGEKKVEYQLPGWGFAILAITIITFGLLQSMVGYTFGRLIPTLLMIESPQENIVFDPLPQTDSTDPDRTIKDPDVILTRPPFLTSSFRATLRYLSSKGGFRARFRGISIYLVSAFAVSFLASIISAFPFIPRWLGRILAVVACAQLSLTWTQIVISEPSPKTWFRRIPSGLKIWKKVAAPTAILAVAEELTFVLPIYLALAYGIDIKNSEGASLFAGEKKLMALKSLSVAALAIILSVVLVIPANVILTRVQASLLDDSEETIVPFDRSFGGKVIPEIVGGSGVIGILDAWKTFDWNARVRLVKAYLKVWAMQVMLTILLAICVISELFIIVGKDWSKLSPKNPKDGGEN